jgi:hypothetical protein
VGPERDEENRKTRRLYTEEIYDIYSSPNVIWVQKKRRIRRGGGLHIRETEEVQTIFGGKTWGIETTWKT